MAVAIKLSSYIESKHDSLSSHVFGPLYNFCRERWLSTKSGNLNTRIVNSLGFGAGILSAASLFPVWGAVGIIIAIIDALLVLIAKIFKQKTSDSKLDKLFVMSVLTFFVLPLPLLLLHASIKNVDK
jgi:hypothetical protein